MLTYKKINHFNSNRKRQGHWEEYWADGDLSTKGYYKNGERHGLWTRYWSNNMLISKGKYLKGNKIGKWKHWDRRGNLEESVFYVTI